MRESWDQARAKCQAALGEFVEGKPAAFKALWSDSDETVIMGAFGGFDRGTEHVAARLEWASAGSERATVGLRTCSPSSGRIWRAQSTLSTWSAPARAAPITAPFAARRYTAWREANGR